MTSPHRALGLALALLTSPLACGDDGVGADAAASGGGGTAGSSTAITTGAASGASTASGATTAGPGGGDAGGGDAGGGDAGGGDAGGGGSGGGGDAGGGGSGGAPAPSGEHLWSARFGAEGLQMGTSVTVDGAGNVYVTGHLEGAVDGAVDFGGGPLAGIGGTDAFLVKLAPDGAHLWSKRFASAGDERGVGVAADDDGNVFLVGVFRDGIDLGGGPLANTSTLDSFVAKLDGAGNHLWSRAFGGTEAALVVDLAVAPDGGVIACGSFQGAVDLGGPSIASAGGTDVFLARLGPEGEHLWSRGLGGATMEFPQAIAVDALGDVVVTGYFLGTADLGGDPLESAGGFDAFVLKVDDAGDHLWSRRFGDELDTFIHDVALDGDGNVLLAGAFEGVVDFGGGPLVSAGDLDVVIAKLDPAGDHVWGKRLGDPSPQRALAVGADLDDAVLVAGMVTGVVDLGAGDVPPGGWEDSFLLKMDRAGEHLWSKRFGSGSSQGAASSVAADGLGDVLVTGHFIGDVTFGGQQFANSGTTDIFVAKLTR